MVAQDLINFIQAELQKGKTPDSIIPSLTSSGWQPQDIQSAFNQLGINVNTPNTSGPFAKLFKLSAPLLIGVIILILGVSAVLGYWGYQSIFKEKSAEQNKIAKELSPTPTPSPSIKDCGNAEMNIGNEGVKVEGQANLQCMVQQAKTCDNSKLTFGGILSIVGVTQTSKLNYEIGKNLNGCTLQLKQGAIDIVFPTGTPEEQKKPVLDSLKKIENTSGACIYENKNDLAEIFENYQKGNFSITTRFEDSIYRKGKCSGSYFDLLYPFHDPSATTETPIGSEVKAQNFSIKVTNVVLNPNITGDTPDGGMEYFEIHLSITNTEAQKSFVPGEFYYLTSQGKNLATADSFGTEAPNKNVQITGRKSLLGALNPGEIDVSRSLIFQISKGDKGKLIWYSTSLLVTENAAKLAIFKLSQ